MIKRLAKFIEYQGVSVSSFEQTISASDGMIRRAIRNNTDIQSKWITKISENYPDLNIVWLISGKGEMLKTDTPVSAPIQAADTTIIDKLIKEVKDLSAENAVLKREIEELKEEIRNKSNHL